MRTVAGICLLAAEQPALRRQDLYTGFYRERERMFVDAQKALREFVAIVGVVWRNCG